MVMTNGKVFVTLLQAHLPFMGSAFVVCGIKFASAAGGGKLVRSLRHFACVNIVQMLLLRNKQWEIGAMLA